MSYGLQLLDLII